MIQKLLQTSDDYVLAFARLMLATIFFAHGSQLFLGWFGGHGYHASMQAFTGMGIPAAFACLAIIAQFFGALGLILGFLARIAALGIFWVMIVAIAKVHWAVGFFMNWSGNQQGEGFEFHLLALALCVLILAKGAGALSLDLLLSKARTEPAPGSTDLAHMPA